MLKSEMSLQECCELVKDRFHLETVKVFGNLKEKVQRVAISPGSGKHMSEFALAEGAQVLVTGDIDHHEGLDAMERGLFIIDAGHYGLEHIFMEDVAEFIKEKMFDVRVVTAENVHPFQVI